MTKVIARVHPVHLMNVDWAPGGRQPSDQANRQPQQHLTNKWLAAVLKLTLFLLEIPDTDLPKI